MISFTKTDSSVMPMDGTSILMFRCQQNIHNKTALAGPEVCAVGK